LGLGLRLRLGGGLGGGVCGGSGGSGGSGHERSGCRWRRLT
jgi:hypothetical protein